MFLRTAKMPYHNVDREEGDDYYEQGPQPHFGTGEWAQWNVGWAGAGGTFIPVVALATHPPSLP